MGTTVVICIMDVVWCTCRGSTVLSDEMVYGAEHEIVVMIVVIILLLG